MRKADKIKLSVIVGVSLLAFVVGCVDTAVQPLPTSINYKSEVNIVNLTTGAGAATFTVYNATVNQDSLANYTLFAPIDYSSIAFSGTADMGSALPASTYQEVPSGSKSIVASYANIAYKDTFRLAFNSQYKMSVFIFGDTSAGGRTYYKSLERYTWQSPGSSDGAALFPSGESAFRFVNGCPDASSLQIQIYAAANDSLIDFGDFNYQDVVSYYQLAAGNYYFLIVGDNNVYDSVAVSMGSMKRYTIVSYDNNANLQSKVLTDD
jgi:hypothetical protein